MRSCNPYNIERDFIMFKDIYNIVHFILFCLVLGYMQAATAAFQPRYG